MLEGLQFAGARLKPDLGVSLADLELLGPTDLVLVGLDQLGLGLLVSSILLFIVADLIVELLEVILERHDLILRCSNRILQARDIFISLLDDLLLVPDSILGGLNLSLDVLNRVL